MFSHSEVWLTPDEFGQFLTQTMTLREEFRKAHDKSDPNSHLYEIDIIAANDTV